MKNTLCGIGFILFAILCLQICELGVYLGFDPFIVALFFGVIGILIVIIEFFRNVKDK